MALNDKEKHDIPAEPNRALEASQAAPRKYQILYLNVLSFTYWHVAGLYGLYLAFTSAKWATLFFNAILYVFAIQGITAGSHRLWAHRSYKAKMPLQILLMLFHCLAYQNPSLHWARDHRLHHKYSDTDADPHNAKRGFFFSHIGWLMVQKHPDAVKRGRTIDVSDIYENPVLQFQKKYFFYLGGLMAFVLPALIPAYFWGESLITAYHVSLLRLITVMNVTFLVNSAAHKYGNRPYDQHMLPTQSIALSLATLGECYHNYHHVFPFDYRTSEFGNYFNFTTKFIDFFAWIGWAYDLKQASPDMINKRAKRTGDGTDLWGRMKELDSKDISISDVNDSK